eukprot:403373213
MVEQSNPKALVNIDVQAIEDKLSESFYIDWNLKFQESNFFKDSIDKLINQENVEEVLRILELDNLIKVNEAQYLLTFYENNQATFENFQRDLYKLMNQIASAENPDLEYDQIIGAYSTPAERIIKTLIQLKDQYLKDVNNEDLKREINFAINNIAERKIYQATATLSLEAPKYARQHSHIIEGWLNEYSEVNHESSSSSSLKAAKLHGLSRNSSSSSADMSSLGQPVSKDQIQSMRRKSNIRSLIQDYEKMEDQLKDTNTREFSIFEFTSKVGRNQVLPIQGLHFFMQHHLDVYVNERKLSIFFDDVMLAYRKDVQYHNDLHGVDVAHMANLFLTQGKLIQLAELEHIDIMAFIVAALCHDLGHDGFTNGYHVNALTDRAITYNDISVQENYHVAQTFAIIKRDETNFLEQMTTDEMKVFRKRVIGCILATDMAKHAADLSALKSLVEAKSIKNGENASQILNKENEASIFKSQQFIMECCLHACDVSQPTRTFPVVKEWTYLLFEEFFQETTIVPKMQPGFINGITLPLWSVIAEIMPSMKEYVDEAKANVSKWEQYEETEEDKKIY